LKAEEVLAVVIAQKMKKSISEISFSKSIKELVEGKSTLQNEMIGDLQKEFGTESIPEKSEELPLKEVATYLSVGYSGDLGKFTSSLISKLISNKMPPGFSMKNIKSYLTNEFGLGPKRIDGVLLHRYYSYYIHIYILRFKSKSIGYNITSKFRQIEDEYNYAKNYITRHYMSFCVCVCMIGAF
jgi:hypothetical protein